jgi:hypothetical protein
MKMKIVKVNEQNYYRMLNKNLVLSMNTVSLVVSRTLATAITPVGVCQRCAVFWLRHIQRVS